MNQERKASSFSLKKILIHIAVSLVSLVILMLISALILQHLDRFERFYGLCGWIICGLEAVILSVLARKEKNSSVALAGTVSLIVSLLIFAVGLIICGGQMDVMSVILRLLSYCLLSVLFTLIPLQNTKSKGRGKKRKFKRK